MHLKNGIALTALIFSLIFLFSLIFQQVASAAGVTPYLPANMPAQFENDIEKLAALTNIPQLTKPYNIATVLEHLKKIRTSHPAIYKRLDRALAGYYKNAALTQAKLSLSTSDADEPIPLVNQMGSTSDQSYWLKAHGHWQETPWLGIYAGIDTSNERTLPSGSVLAMGTSWAQLDIGYKERWWSPFQGSAQVISTNAETLPSIGLSNNTPIELFGTYFSYDVFVAQTSRQLVLYQDEWSDTNKPYLSGMHFSFQPVEWWSIGVNRMFQFGGGERETGLKDILRAVINPRGADNAGERDDINVDEETGNQIASIVSRMNFQDFSIYMEYAGEDTSNNKIWQLGNTAINAGVYIPTLFNDKLSLTYEYSEWQDKWYSHHLYEQGLANNNFITGNAFHQAPDLETNLTANEAGSSKFLNAHFLINAKQSINIRLSSAKKQTVGHSHLRAEFGYTFPISQMDFEIHLYSGDIQNYGTYYGLMISGFWK